MNPEGTRLRVLTYNIFIGTGTDKKIDLERTARVIRSASPDLVALQEVDRWARRSAGVDQPAELARLTGLNMAFGKASVREGSDERGGDYGNAILTRLPINWYATRQLPFTPGFELRCVLEVELDWRPGGKNLPLRFFATHFDNASADDRLASATLLVQLANQRPEAPSILAGDLNAVPSSEPLGVLRQAWQVAGDGQEHPTFPANNPRRQLDYILFRPAKRWKVSEFRVLDEGTASDHRPVLAVLELL